MFIWYKKGDGLGKQTGSRTIAHYIIGVILLAVIGGVIFFFSNSKEIISSEELKALAVEEGFEYSEGEDGESSIAAEGITASVMECSSSAEAGEMFEQYCAEYPSEDADNTQSIDFGDRYAKYQASGDQGILIAARTGSQVAVVRADDIANEETAKELFAQIVK